MDAQVDNRERLQLVSKAEASRPRVGVVVAVVGVRHRRHEVVARRVPDEVAQPDPTPGLAVTRHDRLAERTPRSSTSVILGRFGLGRPHDLHQRLERKFG